MTYLDFWGGIYGEKLIAILYAPSRPTWTFHSSSLLLNEAYRRGPGVYLYLGPNFEFGYHDQFVIIEVKEIEDGHC